MSDVAEIDKLSPKNLLPQTPPSNRYGLCCMWRSAIPSQLSQLSASSNITQKKLAKTLEQANLQRGMISPAGILGWKEL